MICHNLILRMSGVHCFCPHCLVSRMIESCTVAASIQVKESDGIYANRVRITWTLINNGPQFASYDQVIAEKRSLKFRSKPFVQQYGLVSHLY